MSILFCTPAYGGFTHSYVSSVIPLTQELLHQGVDHSFYFIRNESLVQRARNTCVATFLRTEFEHLMFIDADIGFGAEDVRKLWEMDRDLSVGVYRMKRPGSAFAAWKDGELRDLDGFEGPVTVDYAGTGFMLIRRRVFEDMQAAHPEWRHVDGHDEERWSFFDCELRHGTYLSEDYLFCERWRELGGEVWLHPEVRVRHEGSHVYD